MLDQTPSRVLRDFLGFGNASSFIEESRLFRGFAGLLSRVRLSMVSSETISAWGRALLVLLLFSCLFIPRFAIGSITSSYQVDLRTEDLLLLVIGVLLLWVMTGKKDPRPTYHGPREKFFVGRFSQSFLWFLLACEISILNGMIFRTIDKPLLSFLYLLKWVEYFLVFLATAYFAVTSKDSVFFLKVFFLLGIAAAGYGWWEHLFPAVKAVYPNYYRLYERAPFHGDANHIGGFLVLWIGFFTGIFLKTESTRTRSLLLAALAFVFFPFIWTYSRKSYFALAGALVFPFLFRGVRKKNSFSHFLSDYFSVLFPDEAFGAFNRFGRSLLLDGSLSLFLGGELGHVERIALEFR